MKKDYIIAMLIVLITCLAYFVEMNHRRGYDFGIGGILYATGPYIITLILTMIFTRMPGYYYTGFSLMFLTKHLIVIFFIVGLDALSGVMLYTIIPIVLLGTFLSIIYYKLCLKYNFEHPILTSNLLIGFTIPSATIVTTVLIVELIR